MLRNVCTRETVKNEKAVFLKGGWGSRKTQSKKKKIKMFKKMPPVGSFKLTFAILGLFTSVSVHVRLFQGCRTRQL